MAVKSEAEGLRIINAETQSNPLETAAHRLQKHTFVCNCSVRGCAGAAATMNDACSGGPWAAIEATDTSGTEQLPFTYISSKSIT